MALQKPITSEERLRIEPVPVVSKTGMVKQVRRYILTPYQQKYFRLLWPIVRYHELEQIFGVSSGTIARLARQLRLRKKRRNKKTKRTNKKTK